MTLFAACRSNMLSSLLAAFIFSLSAPAFALADTGFRQWISEFRSVATRNGVSGRTYDAVFAGISSPDPEVIRKANFQPEFKSKVWDYIDNRVTESAIETGRINYTGDPSQLAMQLVNCLKHSWVETPEQMDTKA